VKFSLGIPYIKWFTASLSGGWGMPVSLIISCGCGFKTTSLEEAEEHAKQTRHVLRIQGSVTPYFK